MLGLNLYEYGKMDGRNDYQQHNNNDDKKAKVVSVIFKVASKHKNFPVNELIKLIEKEDVVFRYFLNNNSNVKDDKNAQDLICDILYLYEEEEIDTILSELDCSE